MLTVNGSDLAKNFGQYAQRAQREAVQVTTYGRAHVVILSPHEYERLRRQDRQVLASADLPADIRRAIAKARPSKAAARFNHEAEG